MFKLMMIACALCLCMTGCRFSGDLNPGRMSAMQTEQAERA